MDEKERFAELLLHWWDQDHSDLPWRRHRDPYAVWVAEVMLQQTQIATVIPYYEKWMERLPDIEALAESALDEVLKLWEGLGYYSRARNMHAAAGIVLWEYDGRLPDTVRELMKLPGIGRYTAGAIASIAYDVPAPVLDGNVTRVLSRIVDLEEDVTKSSTVRLLWRLSEDLLPSERPGAYNQALMELGQRVCIPSSPRCSECPVSNLCSARRSGTQFERPVRPQRIRIPHYNVVAGVIWLDDIAGDARFLITRRPYDKMLGGLWEFPGGKVQSNESLEEALEREIAEELAVEIVVNQPLCNIRHAYTHFRITLEVFHARLFAGTPQNIGVADHVWVTLADVDDYAFAATDLQVIAALREQLQNSDHPDSG